MLRSLGMSSLDELFPSVPEALRLAGGLDLEPGLSEPDTLAVVEGLAARNRRAGPELVCFAGGGAYDHEVPSTVRRVAFRSEFVTAYTPYQPEVAQGVLQALFEYQTLLCRLTGMDVANASLYDGASACVEAVNLACAATGRQTVWVSQGVNPNWRDVVRPFSAGTGPQSVGHRPRDRRTAAPTGPFCLAVGGDACRHPRAAPELSGLRGGSRGSTGRRGSHRRHAARGLRPCGRPATALTR